MMNRNAMNRNALNQYSQASVELGIDAASPHKLILMLFDGAITALANAKNAMHHQEIARKCEAIAKAMSIIEDGLILSLDRKAGGELAENLFDLYNYMCDRLLVANIKSEIEPVDEVSHLLTGLRDAWASIGTTQNKAPNVAADNAVPPQRAASLSYGSV